MEIVTDLGPIRSGIFAGSGVKARVQLFARTPDCYWCGRQTTLEPCLAGRQGQPTWLTATMDHLRDRGPRDDRLVLACHECNQIRAALARKVRTRARLSKQFRARLAVLVPLWQSVGRPEMAPLVEYVLGWRPS